MKILFASTLDYSDNPTNPAQAALLNIASALRESDELVVVAMNTGGENYEFEDGLPIIDCATHLQECLEINEWDWVISTGLSMYPPISNYTPQHGIIEWANTGRFETAIGQDVIVVARSEHHAAMLNYFSCSGKSLVTIPNMPLTDYTSNSLDCKKWNKRFCYYSDWRAGLHLLADVWPYVLEEEPESRLIISPDPTASLNSEKWSHYRNGEDACKVKALCSLPNVEVVELSLAEQVHTLANSVLVYPYDPVIPCDLGQDMLRGAVQVKAAIAGNPSIFDPDDPVKSIPRLAWIPRDIDPQAYASLLLGATELVNTEDPVRQLNSVIRRDDVIAAWQQLLCS